MSSFFCAMGDPTKVNRGDVLVHKQYTPLKQKF